MHETPASQRADPASDSPRSIRDRNATTAAQIIASNTDPNMPKKTSRVVQVHNPRSYVKPVIRMPHQMKTDYVPNDAKSTSPLRGESLIDNPSALVPNPSIGSTSNYNQTYSQRNYAPNGYDYVQGQAPRSNMHVMNHMRFGYGDASLMYSPYGDMTIQSQDIDTSGLGENMMSWLDRLPPDERYFYDPQNPTIMDYRDAG